MVHAKPYDNQMQALVDIQLDFEALKLRAESNAKALSTQFGTGG